MDDVLSHARTPTLDQLRVLAAIVDSGSFSAAARVLGRRQSVVSYTVAVLESQLGLSLFVRGGRRPALTEAGRAVLADARRVAAAVDQLRARVAALGHGLEAELAVAVDVMFPTDRLVVALRAFAEAFPTVALRLRVEALGGVMQLVLDGASSLGVSGWGGLDNPALEARGSGFAHLVPVAAPQHPLAAFAGPIPTAALRDQTQLVLIDRSRGIEGRDHGVLSIHTWRLADLGAKHALLRAGLGWGNMPAHVVREDLETGRLARLRLEEGDAWPYPFTLVRRADTPLGPAGTWLADRLAVRDD